MVKVLLYGGLIRLVGLSVPGVLAFPALCVFILFFIPGFVLSQLFALFPPPLWNTLLEYTFHVEAVV